MVTARGMNMKMNVLSMGAKSTTQLFLHVVDLLVVVVHPSFYDPESGFALHRWSCLVDGFRKGFGSRSGSVKGARRLDLDFVGLLDGGVAPDMEYWWCCLTHKRVRQTRRTSFWSGGRAGTMEI